MPLRSATQLSPEKHHFIGFWAEAGYAGWLTSMDGAKLFSGAAPSFGVGYRLFSNNFILQTGVEGQYIWMKGSIPEIRRQELMNDNDIPNEQFLMSIHMYNYTDVNMMVNVHVPLLVGYENGRFYALGGIKAGMNVLAKAVSSATMTTTADYEPYIGMMEDLPNHGIGTAPVTSGEQNFRMGLNLTMHLEAGARLDKFKRYKAFHIRNHPYRVYLGAYLEYGMANVHTAVANGPMAGLDLTHGVQANLVPMMLCNEMKNGTVNPLAVGVKFTMLFELPQHGKSYIYDWKKETNGYRKRGGNQIIK